MTQPRILPMTDASPIDLVRYPVGTPGKDRDALVARIRSDLARDGCAVLKRFLTETGLARAVAEAESVSDRGHRSFNRTNPYFTADDPSLPAGDPRRAFFARSNNFIAAEHLAEGGPIRAVWDTPGFDAFIHDCLEAPEFHRYADPLADVIVNMAEAGEGFPWHFDTNNFTVTLALQNAEDGGAFEYAANIRGADENFAEVAEVLAGTSARVRVLHLEPGDLQIFKGRNSLHRVAPLSGSRPRFVAIFSYVEEPGMVATPERARQLYGKALPIHFERAGRRADSFID